MSVSSVSSSQPVTPSAPPPAKVNDGDADDRAKPAPEVKAAPAPGTGAKIDRSA